MDQRDGRTSPPDARLSSGLVALPREARGNSERRREAVWGTDHGAPAGEERGEHRRLLRLRRMTIRGEAQELNEHVHYLEDNWAGLYGSWSLRGKVQA